jgi:hypothetical protein
MDPITVTIVSAVAAGAAAGASEVATSAIKDAYAGLKRLIADGYRNVAPFVDAVEADPASKPEQTVLAKELDQAGAAKDDELKAAAQALLDAIESLRDEPRAAALFDFDQLRVARDVQLEDIEAVRVIIVRGRAEIGRDLRAKRMRQRPTRESPEKK